MDESEILKILTGIFRQIFDDDSIVLNRETTAADIADWDSFNHINMMVVVEERFQIKFETAETEELHNIGALIDVIKRKLGNRKVS